MTRVLAALVLSVLSSTGQAQEAGRATMICLSVGGSATWTQIAIYGDDYTALSMTIPPDGDPAPMESYTVSLPVDAFSAMVATLRPGMADLPPPPDPATCAEDTFGPVSIALQQVEAETLRYDAPCPTDAVLALNEALIAATGDPAGEPLQEWSSPAIPTMRDICRTSL